jgi:L-ascorbate metabolism protein UlaG (beta-lactamase superfamily)
VTGLSRRGVLGAATATTAALLGAAAPSTAAPSSAADPNGIRIRWLGNNGWEIAFEAAGATRVILIDPWLTRFHTGTYTKAGADPDTPLRVDTGLLDGYGLRADQILVTHGHYDHLTDVPHLAATTGATVFGTESHANLLRALGAPAGQLSEVHGGEYLQFPGYTIQVLPSLHSLVGARSQVPFPGTRPAAPPRRPRVIADLVEGGTLAYQITIGDGFRVLNLGAANYLAPALAGLAPDLAFVQPGGATVHDYVPRLLAALDHPRYVLPTHWDDFDHPLAEPARDWGGLTALRTAVAAASPTTQFVQLDHLQTFSP